MIKLIPAYEVSDRIDWVNGLSTSIEQADDTVGSRFVSNTLSSGFNFYLTNQVDLSLSVVVVDTSVPPNVDASDDELSRTFNMAVHYRLR